MAPNDVTRTMLRTWILAARPKTLWAGICPVIIGTVLAIDAGAFHPLWAALALVGAILIQIGTNFANDYFDWIKGADTVARIGPLRATQAGLIEPQTMLRGTIIVFAAAALIGAILTFRGGWPIFVIGVSSILCGVLYTAGPRPLGYLGLGEVFVLIYFGPVAVAGTYFVQTLSISPLVILIGLAPGLFSVAILTVNNLRDIEGDRRAGKRTLAVRLGRPFTRIQYLCSLCVATLIPALAYWIGGGKHPLSLLAVLVLLLALPAIRTVFVSTDGPRLNQVLGATGRLLLIFTVVLSTGWLL